MTFVEAIFIICRIFQVYSGFFVIKWGIDMYDAGQSLPFITQYPEATSLFIIIMLAIIFMVQ